MLVFLNLLQTLSKAVLFKCGWFWFGVFWFLVFFFLSCIL